MVAGLNKSKVGGFSWAMAGSDGGAYGVTKVTSFEGFDYVTNPGFSANRGYVLESAGKDLILESICKAGIEDNLAEKYLESWAASAQFQALELEERLADAEVFESAMAEKIETLETQVQEFTDQADTRRSLITECSGKLPVVVPEDVAEALISMANEDDFYKLVGFFESAAKTDLARYPLPGAEHKKNHSRCPSTS